MCVCGYVCERCKGPSPDGGLILFCYYTPQSQAMTVHIGMHTRGQSLSHINVLTRYFEGD